MSSSRARDACSRRKLSKKLLQVGAGALFQKDMKLKLG